jgi:hypothetical protein
MSFPSRRLFAFSASCLPIIPVGLSSLSGHPFSAESFRWAPPETILRGRISSSAAQMSYRKLRRRSRSMRKTSWTPDNPSAGASARIFVRGRNCTICLKSPKSSTALQYRSHLVPEVFTLLPLIGGVFSFSVIPAPYHAGGLWAPFGGERDPVAGCRIWAATTTTRKSPKKAFLVKECQRPGSLSSGSSVPGAWLSISDPSVKAIALPAPILGPLLAFYF